MRTYVGKKPPGWATKPEYPVIIIEKPEEVAILRGNLFGFTDFWRHKVQPKAEHLFRRHPYPRRVDLCTADGDVLTSLDDIWRKPEPEPTSGPVAAAIGGPVPTRAELLSKIEEMQRQLQVLAEQVRRLPQ